MLHVGLQKQVDAVRQGISEVFPLAKLDQVCGLDLIDAIGANASVADHDWEQMIGMMVMKSDLPGLATYLKLFQDTLKLVKNSEISNCILLFGREFWNRVVNFEELMLEGVISPPDLDLFQFVETAEEAWDAICDFYEVSH